MVLTGTFNILKPFQKGQSITCHKGTKGKERYTSTLSLTPTLDGGWVVNATPQP